MEFEFKMPSLGADMESGRLLEWRVKVGDGVNRGDIIALVDTDKAAIEVEIWKSGRVKELIAKVGEKIKVGAVMAKIDEIGEQESVPVEPEKSLAIAGAIARSMEKSKREIPHYYLSRRVDVTSALFWLEIQNREKPVEGRLLLVAPILWAIADASRTVPEMNGTYQDGTFRPSTEVNMGVIISLRSGGLMAPTLQDAGRKSSAQIMEALKTAVDHARSGVLKSSEMTAGTITVTNLSDSGCDLVFGVIEPPQVAIVGLGSPFEVAVNGPGGIQFKTFMNVSVSADHRVSDARVASVFLKKIDAALQDPR